MAAISYKCPNCDGELVFDPGTQEYKCEYCMSHFTQAELNRCKHAESTEQYVQEIQPQQSEQPGQGVQVEQGMHAEQSEQPGQGVQVEQGVQPQQSEQPGQGVQVEQGVQAEQSEQPGQSIQQEEAVVYTCPSCGAEIVTDATTAATFCYYCHNPVVLSGRLSGEYLPDCVIPFAFDKKQAEQKFLEFVHSKKFIPRSFFRKQQIEKLSGVYFPYWIYECTMDGSMDAQATNIRVWRSGEKEYTETKYYQVEREGKITLTDLSKNALKKADQQLAEGVFPYDMTKKQEFHMGYLSGFLAEKRDIGQDELKQEISQEVNNYGKQMLRDTITGYSGVTINSSSFKLLDEKWSYALLPVWTVTYKGRNGKLYYYSMNGQTGKTYGELPLDYKKVGILGGIVGAVVLLLCLIGGYLI